ncbi:MAG: T9SS type A sorting domain-containing protein [Candidatus Hatepunaea meridiana]|nr:T9SS type A sorting domain-containing protein [Candidatus Hatepunaea meridiana]
MKSKKLDMQKSNIIPIKTFLWGISVLFILVLPFTLVAQTEVEGEVSGEWTADDSPYIVMDSTWVPEDEHLTLCEGVEVQFEEGQGMYIYGTLDASGTERDSVSIRVADDVEHWRGLRFYGRNRTEWSYASIICPDSALVLDPGCSLTMSNCLVDADRAITGDTGNNDGIEGCNLMFSQSVIRSRSYHYAVGGSLTANHTLFDLGGDEIDEPGFHTWWTSFRLTSCEVIGVLRAQDGIVYADSCRFLRTPLGKSTGVAIGLGRMTESYVEGGAGAGRIFTQTVVTFRNNILLGSLYLSGRVNVSGCDIGSLLDIDDCESVSIRNSVIRESIWIRHNNTVVIDSCFFVSDDSTHHRFSADFTSNLTVTRSIFDKSIMLSEMDEVLFDHNTIVFDSSNSDLFASQHHRFTNNIIVTVPPDTRLFAVYNMPVFRYNCVYGFEIAAGPFNDPIPIDEINPSNVIANPLIEWDGIIPYISYNSPCINAGDPEFDLDPDGSRSDIGAIIFDHRHNLKDVVILPGGYRLYDPYPNPFNRKCIIAYDLLVNSVVTIALYDMSGRSVVEFPTQNQRAGYHSSHIEGSNLSSGVYLLKFSANNFQKYSRIVLIR